MGELIPANHPVRVVNDLLDRFDIGEIESTYKGGGTGSYNPFLVENMFYNAEKDFYVCPMGQHLEFACNTKETSDLGYTSTKSVYVAKDCSRCPLRGI